jgi:methylglutaconyl-CoA hydratase
MQTLRIATEADLTLTTITLNRPERRNAISPQMMEELGGALDEAAASRVRAVILTGEGRAFCAGMDLDLLQSTASASPEETLEAARKMARVFLALYRFPKPVIAAVNGAAVAGGCGLATLCDFTLAVPEAKFGYTEVRIGFLPALVSVFLMRQIAEKHASDLLLTGRIIDSAEALRIGLITEVVAADKLMARARELAATLAGNSPESLRRTKGLMRSYAAAEMDREIELALQENAAIRQTADFREGVASFLEKRAPKWE